jgi:diacylglycerol kinase family enzyme
VSAPAPVALVVNPAATKSGRGLGREVAATLRPLGLEWSMETTGPGDAVRLARRAADEGAAVIVTLGGDGTVADVAGLLAGGPVALAPLPGGNANVFARALGWPNAPRRALPLLAAALRDARVREAHLGRLRADGAERVFAINAGIGLDAATVEWIEARPRTKRRLRQAGFALGAAIATIKERGGPSLSASADGAPPIAAAAVLVACGTPYTYLGRRPLDLVPGAAFDGHLAWLALRRARLPEVTRLLVRAVRGRELPIGGPALAGGRIAETLTVRAARPAAVQADGEALGRATELTVSPGPVLRVLVPPPGP